MKDYGSGVKRKKNVEEKEKEPIRSVFNLPALGYQRQTLNFLGGLINDCFLQQFIKKRRKK